MFEQWLQENELYGIIQSYDKYQPYPTRKDRIAWNSLEEEHKKDLILAGEESLREEWPLLPATSFLEFSRSGNREVYEVPYFARRDKLIALVVAECVEGEGRFLDEIINGVWLICEESYWGVSAHSFIHYYKKSDILPNIENQYTDLFAAETASVLAHVIYLLGESLDAITPLVRRRIELELEKRVKAPFLNRIDLHWMGFTSKRVNNWTPWIVGNILSVFLLTERDDRRREDSIRKSMACLEFFINEYDEDGGCDEGPNYWNVAGGALFDCLEQFYMVSKGAINYYENSLVKEIGRFLYRVFIDGRYYVNFADGDAKISISNYMVWRYGVRIGDEKLQNLAIYSRDFPIVNPDIGVAEQSLKRIIPKIFGHKEFSKLTAQAPYERDVWLDGIQVAAARHQASKEGLYFVAKGGHNGESHNHNDVGTFLLYKNGIPGFIDLGVETYTRQTFGEQRYEIWNMQSMYHNLPTINQEQQLPGEDRMAREITYTTSEEQVQFILDIASTYGEDAKIKSYVREYTYHRGNKNQLETIDSYEFTKEDNELMLSYMTWRKPILVKDGKVELSLSDDTKLTFVYDETVFTKYAIEEFEIKDRRMLPVWEDKVYRLTLTAKNLSSKGSIKGIIF